jgi:hypothetical protein
MYPLSVERAAACRFEVAHILSERGPTPGVKLAEALGLTPDVLWMSVWCEWFDVSRYGWVLAPQGMRAVATAARKW